MRITGGRLPAEGFSGFPCIAELFRGIFECVLIQHCALQGPTIQEVEVFLYKAVEDEPWEQPWGCQHGRKSY